MFFFGISNESHAHRIRNLGKKPERSRHVRSLSSSWTSSPGKSSPQSAWIPRHRPEKIYNCGNEEEWIKASFADPDPVPFGPLDSGSGMGKNQDPGWTSWIIFPRAWKQFFGVNKTVLQFFDADPESLIFLTLNPGQKNSDRFGINIPDPQHCLKLCEKIYGICCSHEHS